LYCDISGPKHFNFLGFKPSWWDNLKQQSLYLIRATAAVCCHVNAIYLLGMRHRSILYVTKCHWITYLVQLFWRNQIFGL